MKFAIVIYPDPGSEDALGRCFSGMSAAYDCMQNNDEKVIVIFGGAGVRWPAVLSDKDHPAHDLYNTIKPLIKGACTSCSNVFGAADDVINAGLKLTGDIEVPNSVGGLPSMLELVKDGYVILSF